MKSQDILFTAHAVDVNKMRHENKAGMSWIIAAVFIVGDMMGGGMISLPIALVDAGIIPGVLVILLAALFSGYTGVQLGDNWTMMQERWPEYQGPCRSPYPEMAYRSMGRVARKMVEILLTVSQFLIGSVLLLICAHNVRNLLHDIFGWHIDFCVFIVFLSVGLWPLVMLQSPAHFWQAALVAAATSTIAAVFIVYGAIHDSTVCLPERNLPKFAFSEFALAYGTIVFAFGGHGAFPTIQTDMRKPYLFSRSIIYSYILITFCYIAVGVVGALVYGDSMRDNVINSLQVRWISQAVNILITLHIFPTIVIVFSPTSQQVEEWTNTPHRFCLKRFVVRSVLLLGTTFVSLTILNMEVFLQLVGASTVTLMTMLLPSVFYLYLQASWKKRQERIRLGEISEKSPDAEYATIADILKYTPKAILIFNVISLLFGLIGGGSSTWSGLKAIATSHLETPCYVKWIQVGFDEETELTRINCCGHNRDVTLFALNVTEVCGLHTDDFHS